MTLSTPQLDDLLALYAERVDTHDDAHPGYGSAWRTLCRRMLAHGGDLVVPPLAPEPRPTLLAEGLTVWDPKDTPVRYVTGQDNHCHRNSAELWLTGQAAALGTGYALSDDGLWRQHSWAFTADGAIIETTVARDRYAGVILAGVELWRFALSNADTDNLELSPARIRELPAIAAQLRNLDDSPR